LLGFVQALVRTLAEENNRNGGEEDFEVEHQPLVFNLMTVGSDPLIGTKATRVRVRGPATVGNECADAVRTRSSRSPDRRHGNKCAGRET